MINTARLRAMLGWLAMLLPWLVLGLSLAYGYSFPPSISATYYRSTCIVPFMVILGASGLLLISYKGYDWWDDLICTLCGVFALCICAFPCYSSTSDALVGTFNIPSSTSGMLHNISAILFFCLLAYNSLFLFTKSEGIMTDKKKKRNMIFRVCGVGMVVAMVGIVPANLLNFREGIWLVETVALAFFGVSWLTKSNIYPWLWAEK